MDLLFVVTLILSIGAFGDNIRNTSTPDKIDQNEGSSDTDQELQSQLQNVEIRGGQWDEWSDWSPCSRSCDGGVSQQLRRCIGTKCRGEHVRYKICNMQPCPDYSDFREDQCASFNNIPYGGQMLQWVAYYDDHNPCALTCKGRESESTEILSEEDAVMVVAKLADKVHDGTRCRPGSLDMCIDGKCQRVGCDLRIGSTLQIDACGVCGGDGSSCSQPLYHWTLKIVSLCSATCGGGYKMTSPVCQNRVTGAQVEEELCNASQKPDTSAVRCNMHSCPPKWHASEWGHCPVSCGGGVRQRQVYCVEETNNTKIKVDEEKCSSARKPKSQEPCNQIDCPKWHTSPWSGCSVSCGEGVQSRIVACRDFHDYPSASCNSELKPASSKLCSTGIQCPEYHDTLEEILPGLYHTQPLVHPYPPPAPAQAERLIGEQQTVPSESTFIAEEWGPCSVTCGEGIRKREVSCKIFLEFSKTIAKLPDHQCNGPKPNDFEKCFVAPCQSERIDIKDDPYRSDSSIKVGSGTPGATYSWKTQGFTHCSASCLGGVQELIVNCVQDGTLKVTSPYMCAKELKPEVLVKTCNDHACPPRWNYSEFSQCSTSCGLGIQTREVQCIHEVTQGGGNTVVIPNDRCSQPAPPDRQYCNVLDCPPRWKMSEWSKCSKSCGTGEKTRKVECGQIIAQNHSVSRPEAACSPQRPPDKKPCNTKSCITDADKPFIETQNSTFIQHDWRRERVSLTVGGAATVFAGTTIKIKCPVKRFNRTRIQWVKDNNYLQKLKKYKVSKKGALRISNVNYRDNGVYACIAGKSSANLSLSVKSRPGEFPSSEEIQKHPEQQGRQISSGRYPVRIPDWNEDRSHEGQMDVMRKGSASRTKAPSHSLHSESPISSNSLNGLPPQNTDPDADYDDRVVSLNTPASSNSETAKETSSSGSRPMPHFQQLVSNLQNWWPFQAFSNSRGHRLVTVPETSSLEGFTRSYENLPEEATSDNIFGRATILGKGPPENLKFEWETTEWSKCSQTCGASGFQVRTSRCVVKLNNATQDVSSALCEDAKLETPEVIRKCGSEACSFWNYTEWTPCNESKCFSWNTAIQRREVSCQLENGEFVDPQECDNNEKPPYRQECHNENCKGKWRIGPWSECAAACESEGIKYRIVQCVWNGTRRAAGNACQDQPKPPVIKKCKGPPCFPTESTCTDFSKFCPNVRKMNLCRIMQYQQQCCQSCRYG